DLALADDPPFDLAEHIRSGLGQGLDRLEVVATRRYRMQASCTHDSHVFYETANPVGRKSLPNACEPARGWECGPRPAPGRAPGTAAAQPYPGQASERPLSTFEAGSIRPPLGARGGRAHPARAGSRRLRGPAHPRRARAPHEAVWR